MHIRITDFGSARILDDSSQSQAKPAETLSKSFIYLHVYSHSYGSIRLLVVVVILRAKLILAIICRLNQGIIDYTGKRNFYK